MEPTARLSGPMHRIASLGRLASGAIRPSPKASKLHLVRSHRARSRLERMALQLICPAKNKDHGEQKYARSLREACNSTMKRRADGGRCERSMARERLKNC